jgi:Bacterial SH3 domain
MRFKVLVGTGVAAISIGSAISVHVARADEAGIAGAPDNKLNLRDQPNANAEIIVELPNNTKVHITDTLTNGWLKIIVDRMGDTGTPPERPLFGYVNGKYVITASMMATAAFRSGLSDYQTWDKWFSGLSGPYQAGAEAWAAHRSDPVPPDCASNDLAFRAGCEEARRRLAESDRRRRTDPNYRAGWNSRWLNADMGSVPIQSPVTNTKPSPPDPLADGFASLGRKLFAPSDSGSTIQTFICEGSFDREQPIIVTVNPQNRTVKFDLTTRYSKINCTFIYKDGANAPLGQGETGGVCSGLFADNERTRQTVKIDGTNVHGTSEGTATMEGNSFDFDMETGLGLFATGLRLACKRAHS